MKMKNRAMDFAHFIYSNNKKNIEDLTTNASVLQAIIKNLTIMDVMSVRLSVSASRPKYFPTIINDTPLHSLDI